MSIGREDYQERKEARIDRMEERAARAQAESAAASHAASEIMRLIPPGQPILVGHHSERHHRRDLDKIDRNMRKSIEAGEKAAYYASRAESAANNRAISGDDPDAVEKLEAKLADLQSLQATMKAVNAYYRKHKTLDDCPDLTPEMRRSIETSWARGWYVGIPFPPYELSNNSAEIRRTKDRLALLRQVDQMEHVELDFDGGQIVTNEEINRVQILFDEKPDEATRSKLKSNGFRWSRTEGAWQTQRTPQSLRRACYLFGIDPPKPAPAPTADSDDPQEKPDDFSDIDPAAVRAALESGEPSAFVNKVMQDVEQIAAAQETAPDGQVLFPFS